MHARTQAHSGTDAAECGSTAQRALHIASTSAGCHRRILFFLICEEFDIFDMYFSDICNL
jgi:hypothetical protein